MFANYPFGLVALELNSPVNTIKAISNQTISLTTVIQPVFQFIPVISHTLITTVHIVKIFLT